MQVLCNSCGRKTEHKVIHKEEHLDDHGNRKNEVLLCLGCKELLIRVKIFEQVSGNVNERKITQTSYEPPRLWRRPPDWLEQIEEIDPDLYGLLREVYSATNENQKRLLSMGVRAAIDHMMTLSLGGDTGNFKHKLEEMVDKDRLTSTQAENIEVVIEAGSASSHRGFIPPRELLEEMVIVMENLVREFYVTGPMLKTARQKIPPRP